MHPRLRSRISASPLVAPVLGLGLLLAALPPGARAQAPASATAGAGAGLPMSASPDNRAAAMAGGPDGAEGALTVVRRYYADIDRRAFAAAYRLWDNNGQASRQTLKGFRQGFAHTAETTVVPGVPTDAEGAAGSVYITVPVTVTAMLTDGTRQSFAGSYVLRRVNDVPGATAAARRWHLYSASLKPTS